MSYPKMMATALANPFSSHGLRWHNPDEEVRTGSITLHSNYTIKQAEGNAGTYASVKSGTFITYLFRSPLRSQVSFTANPDHDAYEYASSHWYNDTVVDALPITGPAGTVTNVTFRYMTHTSGIAPHGAILYAGTTMSDDSQDLLWMDKGAVATFTQHAAEADTLNVYMFNGSRLTIVNSLLFNAGTAVFTNSGTTPLDFAANGGYFAFQYITEVPAVGQSVKFALTGNGDVWAHLALPFVATHQTALEQCRLIANSLLITNIASVMNVEGTMKAAQYPSKTLWTQTPALDFTAASTAYMGSAQKGCYGYLRPTSLQEMDFRETFEIYSGSSANTIQATNFQVDGPGVYLAFKAECVSVGAAYPGLDFTITSASILEFITDDQWYEIEYPMLTSTDCDRALDLLREYEVFHENPMHLKDLYSLVRRGWGFTKSNAHAIGGALSLLFPSQAAAIQLLAKGISAL